MVGTSNELVPKMAIENGGLSELQIICYRGYDKFD